MYRHTIMNILKRQPFGLLVITGAMAFTKYCSTVSAVRNQASIVLNDGSFAGIPAKTGESHGKSKRFSFAAHFSSVGGQLCEDLVDNGESEFGCFITETPHGTTGRRWCMIDQSITGSNREWDYCDEKLDYNELRRQTATVYKKEKSDFAENLQNLNVVYNKLLKIKEGYNNYCGASRDELKNRIEIVQQQITTMENLLDRIENIKKTSKVFNSSTPSALNPATVEQNANQDQHDCSAVAGYENGMQSDGLRAAYFSNPTFSGSPVYFQQERNIDHMWLSGSPAPNVHPDTFSVRWDGWIMIPKTETYVFTVENDCGSRLFLEESPVIISKMPQPKGVEATSEESVPILSLEATGRTEEASSLPQTLEGGKKYKIRLEYFHHSALHKDELALSRVTLMWQVGDTERTVIPERFFFSTNVHESLHLSKLDGENYQTGFVTNGALAFLNSNDHYLADVPQSYEKLLFIKGKQRPDREKIQFSLNDSAVIYLAFPQNEDFPSTYSRAGTASLLFHDTFDQLSIYESEARDAKASSKTTMSIFAARAEKGLINMSLKPNVPFIVMMEKEAKTGTFCDAEEVEVSLSEGEHFQSCSTSSEESPLNGCLAGLSGKNFDTPHGSWRTAFSGLGHTLTVSFNKEIELTAVQYKPLMDIKGHAEILEINFDDATTEEVNTLTTDYKYAFKNPHLTKSANITLKAVSDSTARSGGSFVFFGRPCKGVPTSLYKPESIKISFKGQAEYLPTDYMLDRGFPKHAQSGLTYGWERQALPVDTANCVHDPILQSATPGGIMFLSASKDGKCEGMQCGENAWTLDLPHSGIFKVTLKGGSLCTPWDGAKRSYILINDIPVVDEYIRRGQFVEVTTEIDARKTRTLKISSPCKKDCASNGTIIDSIVVRGLASS